MPRFYKSRIRRKVLAMNDWVRLLCLSVVFLCLPDQAWSQFTDAHNYDDSPIGVNDLQLAYSYARADSSIDIALDIAHAKLDLNEGTLV